MGSCTSSTSCVGSCKWPLSKPPCSVTTSSAPPPTCRALWGTPLYQLRNIGWSVAKTSKEGASNFGASPKTVRWRRASSKDWEGDAFRAKRATVTWCYYINPPFHSLPTLLGGADLRRCHARPHVQLRHLLHPRCSQDPT
jgi:hypothetical protein